jgi:hypothetical protein
VWAGQPANGSRRPGAPVVAPPAARSTVAGGRDAVEELFLRLTARMPRGDLGDVRVWEKHASSDRFVFVVEATLAAPGRGPQAVSPGRR